jgi:excinuclease ABC subunit A
VPCEVCEGRRFSSKVLGVRLRGLTVAELLELTVAEALARFGDTRAAARLRPFVEVGLEYLRLGQSTATLSGGEAQRLKLAARLDDPAEGAALFLFDEPTTGLHAVDVERLVAALERLCDRGHTVVVIEHHLELIARADHVIDLGPEGGEGGGQVVAAGAPGDVARAPGSHTGRYLRELVGPSAPARGEEDSCHA